MARNTGPLIKRSEPEPSSASTHVGEDAVTRCGWGGAQRTFAGPDSSDRPRGPPKKLGRWLDRPSLSITPHDRDDDASKLSGSCKPWSRTPAHTP